LGYFWGANVTKNSITGQHGVHAIKLYLPHGI